MRFPALTTLAALLACAGSSPPDQPAPAEAAAEQRTMFEHTFTFPSAERVRVDLAPGTYRAETSLGGVQLRITSLRSGVQPPTVRDLVMGRSATGGGLWELVIHVAETYEVSVTGGRVGQSTTLRIRSHESPGGSE